MPKSATLWRSLTQGCTGRLDHDERGVGIIDTPGGPQTVNVINESAIYALIFKSRKPQARAFRRWVTGEVLPQIRQTGAYAANGQIGQDGSIVLPPFDGERDTWSCAFPASRRTSGAPVPRKCWPKILHSMSRVSATPSKGIEVWWNKVQILGRSSSARDEGFSAHQLEKAVLDRRRAGGQISRLAEISCGGRIGTRFAHEYDDNGAST